MAWETTVKAVSSRDNKEKILHTYKEVNSSLNLSTDWKKSLEMILSSTLRVLSANSGSIMLFDKKSGALWVQSASGLNFPENSLVEIKRNGVASEILRKGKAVLIQGKVTDSLPRRTEIISSICCPLKEKDSMLGVFNVNSTNRQKKFGYSELSFLKHICMITADMLSVSIKYEHDSYYKQLHPFLSDIRNLFVDKLSLRELFSVSLKKIADFFKCELCNFYLFSKGDFYTYASNIHNVCLLERNSLKLNKFLSNQFQASQSGFMINRFNSLSQSIWFVGLPVKVNGNLFGIIIMELKKNSVPFIEYHVLSKQVEFIAEELTKIINFNICKIHSIRNAAISEFTAALSEEKSVAKIIKSVGYYVCVALGIASVIICSREKETRSVKTILSLSFKGKEYLNQLIKINQFVLMKASAQNKPLLIGNLADSGFLSNDKFTKSVISGRLFSSFDKDYFFSIYDKIPFGDLENDQFTGYDMDTFVILCEKISQLIHRSQIKHTPI